MEPEEGQVYDVVSILVFLDDPLRAFDVGPEASLYVTGFNPCFSG